jgi:hypothetical protein
MQNVKPTNKEHLIDYLIKHISLGTYDRRFLDNLLLSNVAVFKPVTTNQSDLLDKITSRYHRQLAKQELDSRELIKLPWALQPVESLPQYTQAHISIEDDKVIVRSPYKKDFVRSIKDVEWIEWNKENKTWSAPATELTIKDIINLTEGHYNDVNYCPLVTDIINTLAEYEAVKYWNPTLVRINGNLLIVACNNKLLDALGDEPLDLSLASLAKFAYMGIEVSQDIIAEVYDSMEDGDTAFKDIAFALDPTPLVEITNISSLAERLKSIGTDMVILAGWYVSNKSYLMEIANNLKAEKIEHKIYNRKDTIDIDPRQYKMPVKLELGISYLPNAQYIAKTIRLVNSNPVEYK